MHAPPLSSKYFLRDAVLYREDLFGAAALARLTGARREGDAVIFTAVKKITVYLPCPAPDFSRFNQLSLLAGNFSAIPLLAGLRLIHGVTGGESKLLATSFSGGREDLPPGQWTALPFPRECFGVYGFPDGWKDIRALEIIFGQEKTVFRHQEISVALASITGECRRLPPGPRLTAAGLRKELSSDILKNSPSFPQSCAAAHFRRPYGPDNPALGIAPPYSYPRETADAILAGRIMGRQLSIPISWAANPGGELEWSHFLHRHHFLRTLVQAYVATGNEGYVKALDRMVRSWIVENPMPLGSNGGAGPAWETLSLAWRLREWLWLMGIAWSSGAFRPATKILMLRSIWEQAESLMEYRGHPNNWLIVESAALALMGLILPEFRRAAAWRATGFERLEEEFHRQFWADGVHWELSPLYHAICLHALLEVKETAQVKGVKLPEIFNTPLAKGFDYLMALCRPDFTWPALNDSGGAAGDYTALLLKAGEIFSRPDLLWIGSRGKRGRPPAAGSQVFAAAGIAVMRSGFEAGANYLLFRAGPPGLAHFHQDALSLEVAVNGTPCLVDPGITRYAPGALTDYYRSAAAHNMILIDGAGPDYSSLSYARKVQTASANLAWQVAGHFETAAGIFTGPWESGVTGCAVTRTVLFVRREYWIVRDIITGQGRHEVSAHWQFAPGRLEAGEHCRSIDYLDSGNCRRLRLISITGSVSPAIKILEGSRQPWGGWISLDGRDRPAPQARFTWRIELPFTLVWVLLPAA